MTTLAEPARKRRPRLYDAQRTRYGGVCQWLSPEGRRCRRTATWRGAFHGDSELSHSNWVLVEVCAEHAKSVFEYDTYYELAK